MLFRSSPHVALPSTSASRQCQVVVLVYMCVVAHTRHPKTRTGNITGTLSKLLIFLFGRQGIGEHSRYSHHYSYDLYYFCYYHDRINHILFKLSILSILYILSIHSIPLVSHISHIPTISIYYMYSHHYTSSTNYHSAPLELN